MSDAPHHHGLLPVVTDDPDRPEHPGQGCSCGSSCGRGPVADASVGRARPTDAPAVGVVQAAVWTEAFGTVLEPAAIDACTPQAFSSAWRRSLTEAAAGHLLLVARAGDQVVGFAAFGPSTDPDADAETAELLVFGVHPQARRDGHGSRLLNAVADEARGHGHTWLDAWVPATDDSTRAFLVGAGFGPDGARRERVVGSDGRTLTEVRLGTNLAAAPA